MNRCRRALRILTALAAVVAAGCAGSVPPRGLGLEGVVMQPPERGSGSAADSTAAPAAAVPASGDSVSGLTQALLMLPFADQSDYDGAWPVSAGLSRALGDSLRANPFYRIVPVDSVLALLRDEEQRGRIDPRRAAELARFLGADWAVMGEIDELTMRKFQATVPLGGYRSYQGVLSARLTLVNAIDGRPLEEFSAESVIDSRSTGITNPAVFVPYEKQYYLMDEIVWASDEFRESLVGKAVVDWLKQAAAGVAEDVRPPPSLQVSEPRIIDIDGAVAYINVGLVDGIRSGDKFGVWDGGRDLRDPVTGTVLGRAPPRRVGVVQVEQILNDHLAQVRILDGGADIVAGFRLRDE